MAIRSKALPRVAHPLAPLFTYQVGDTLLPGAANEAYQSPWENPIVSVRGRGRFAGALSVVQPAQVWFSPQHGLNGLGGLQAGQLILQPLLDPTQYEGD